MRGKVKDAWSKEYLSMAERRVREARRAFDRERTRPAMEEWLEAVWEYRDVLHFYCVTQLRGEPPPPPAEEFRHVM